MSLQKDSRFSSILEDLIEIGPAFCIGAVTAWGTKVSWAKFFAAQVWFAKCFFGALSALFGLGTLFLGCVVVYLLLEMVKEHVIGSKE